MEDLLIKGTNLAVPNNLTRVGDLVYFEGPLLTLFENSGNGHFYLFDWIDRDKFFNRWLVYRISPAALLSFISNQISHLDLFKSNPDGKFYFTDIEAKHKMNDYALLELIDVPLKYFPNSENYFDKADCPFFGKIRALTIRALFRTKQDNEYSTHRIPISSLSFDSMVRPSNKINPNRFGTIGDNLNSFSALPASIIINIDNRYDWGKSFNLKKNRNPRIKKMNRVYA